MSLDPWTINSFSRNCSVTRWWDLTRLKQLQVHCCHVLGSLFFSMLLYFSYAPNDIFAWSDRAYVDIWFKFLIQGEGYCNYVWTTGIPQGLPLQRVHITGYQTLICLAGTSNFCRLPSSFSFHFFHCKQKSNKHKQSIEHIRKQKEQTDHNNLKYGSTSCDTHYCNSRHKTTLIYIHLNARLIET